MLMSEMEAGVSPGFSLSAKVLDVILLRGAGREVKILDMMGRCDEVDSLVFTVRIGVLITRSRYLFRLGLA